MMSLNFSALAASVRHSFKKHISAVWLSSLLAVLPLGVLQAQVSLSVSALPQAASPGVQLVRVTGSQYPAGVLSVANLTVSLAPVTAGAGPTVQATPTGVARIVGTTATVTFTVPSSLTFGTPTAYQVSVSGTTGAGAAFQSKNTSNLTINPPASAVLLPATGQQGQSLSVNLTGSYSNFTQGATTANFGPGISVGGAVAGTAGLVTVTGPTSAAAQLVIAANATPAVNTVMIATGVEQIASSFTISPVAAQTIDLAVTKSHTGSFTQGQNGTFTIGVSNSGVGPTSGTVTVTDTLPSPLTLVSMSGTGWSCVATTCTRSDALPTGSAYPAITLVAGVSASAPASVTNSVTVSGGGTDSNTINNTTSDTAAVAQAAVSVTATAGTPQSAAINTAFTTLLQATVKDAGGNPVTGVRVTFAAPPGGASGAFSGGVTAVTNASGLATASAFTANGTVGAYTVTARVVGVSAGASFSLTNTAGTQASIVATSGTPQSTAINMAFGSALQVLVKDAGGNPLSGVTVTFAAPASGASAAFASGNTAVTNASGIAISSTLAANGTGGAYTVAATVSGVNAAANFSLTNTAGAAASITATAGTPQSAVISTVFGSALQVLVKDAGGNPLSGVTVTFAAPAAGASATFVGGNTAVTGANGVATSGAATANALVGSYTVAATVAGVAAPANFALTNTVGPPASIGATAGTPQSAPINTAFGVALQATVKDAGGNPVNGVTVTFAAPASGASGSFGGGVTAITNVNGIATASPFTANGTAGGYAVIATTLGVTGSATFALTNTVGTPTSIAVQSGAPQSAVINTAFGATLQALVKDAGGNPLSGVTVTFSLPVSGASASIAGGNTAVTGANGVATSSVVTANGTVGGYSVVASVSGVSATANFALANTVGPAASITATAGTSQSATINTTFATTLQVVVKDAGGNPVSGATVTFVAPTTGASGSFAGGTTAVTNANGVATAPTFTANSTVGAYTVTATTSGVSAAANFALTNTVGAAASITATAGTPQSAVISTAFALPLQVVVKDAGGNPVSGVTVTFVSSGLLATCSFSPSSQAVTNASGLAISSPCTANSTAGAYTVTANVAGIGLSTSFFLTNTVGAPASITAISGTPQSAQVGTAFATSLHAEVRDAGGNLVSGATVTFTSPSANDGSFAGGLLTATAVTANGEAFAPVFTAGTLATSYSVSAAVSGVTGTATFVLSNTAGAAASITATAGAGQSATVGTAFTTNLQATVKDGSGNPASGVTVTFTSPSTSAGSFAGGLLTATATTGSNGVAAAPVFTAGLSAFNYNITATAQGITGAASFLLTNTPGAANIISVFQGSGQSTIINTAFSGSLVAIVKDSNNNAVSGVVVTFAAPGSGASASFAGGVVTATTNTGGLAISEALTANATAGSYNVTATAAGVASPTSFSLTNTPGVPATLAIYGGSSQSTPVNTAFPSNLSAIVRDSGNNGVSGVTVTFAAPTMGASGSFAGGVTTAVTGTNGIATAPIFTANATPGSYQVVGSVSGVTSQAVYTLTNTQANITVISPTSGTLAQTLNVAITGVSSHFAQGTTTAYFGTGITVNSVTVTSATAATVNLTIAPTTSLGYRNVTLTTGSEVATYTNGFYVNQGSAAIVSLAPNTAAQGTQANVAVVGSNTNFQQGVTTAYFGQNIGVNSVTVTDLTHATVNITVSGNAPIGTQSVSLTTGGEVASLSNGFSVTNGTAVITTVNPGSGNQGDAADTITISGQATHFVQGTTTASFGTGVTVSSMTVNSATQATVVIAIAANAPIGNRLVTLTTGSEGASSAANAFSVAAGVPSAIANPNFGIQGTNPTITINGSFTSFVQGVTTVSFNDGNIVVGAVTVNGPTQLSVPITLGTGASVGNRTVSINTNGNGVTAAFHVVAGMPAITLISPNVGVPNSTVSVHITGNFTNWTSGATQVSFGAGISVGGGTAGAAGPVTVNNTGDLTASINIASGATLGARTVTVTTGSEVESVSAGFTIQTCTTTAPTVILNNPATNATNVPLNSIFQFEFNAPIDRTTVNTSDFRLYDNTTGQYLPGTVSVDASARVVTFTPGVLLGVGRSHYAQLYPFDGTHQIKDTCGNGIGNTYFYFTTSFATETAGPVLTASSPQAGDTVAENAQVVLQFSAPIDPITQPAGIVVSVGGAPVAGTYTPSADYTQFKFVPGAALPANMVVTVTTTSALQDGAGNALTNPGSFTFTTTGATDTTTGSVLYGDPYTNEMNVSTTIHPTFYLSKQIDPLLVNVNSTYLTTYETGRRISATVSVAADRLSVTLTPVQPLQPNTEYYYSLNTQYDLQGNYIYNSTYYFYTGNTGAPATTTVSTISPQNGQTGAPVNTKVVALMSAPVDAGNVAKAITVKAGSTAVAGMVVLGSDQRTLTFTPTANLAVSTTYTVIVGGFLDANQLAVQGATSSFTTGSSATAQTGVLTLVSVTPANGATGVSNTSPVTITFSAPVNPATINNILVRDASNSYYEVSGAWAVSGSNPAQVIFTPSAPYPASSQIQVWTQNQVQDLAGNTDNAYVVTTFTAAGSVDSSAFQVVGISPSNGMMGVGRNATISITFNKSVNRSSLNPVNALTLFAGDANIGIGGITYSADGRTISFTPVTPPTSTINVDATPLITDLSGNPLVNFTSSYSTIADITGTSPAEVGMLPGNGKSDVLRTTPISIYTNSAALNPATVTSDSFHVSQNGVLVQGTIAVSPGGQTVTFTPSSPFSYGALVQVFMLPTVTDIYGNSFSSYSGQFTIQGNPSTVAPVMIGTSPVANVTGVGTNVLPQMKFDQPLLATSVDSTSVFLFESCNGTQIPGTAAVLASDPTILQFTPSISLPTMCNSNPANFYLQINNQTKKVTNLNGVAVSGQPYFYFTVGSGPDNTTPTVLSVAPPAGAVNVGVNAVIYLQFSEPVNPLSLNGTTVQISGAGQTAVPQTITFDATNTLAMIQDQGPLQGNTAITINVNGVTNYAGTSVTPYTSSFATTTTVIAANPLVISESVPYNATNVPTNTVLSIQFDQAMAPNSFTPSTFYIADSVTGLHVPATISISADFTTATLTPLTPLSVNRQYYYQALGVRGVTGNGTNSNYYFYFTTQATTSALLPVVTAVNPTNGSTNVPTNTVIQLLFNEPIAPDAVTGVTISQNGTPIAATIAFSSNNTVLSVTPAQLLIPNTAYTITAANAMDTSGHPQGAAFTSIFTTGGYADLTHGSVAPSYIPQGNQTNVALNIHPTFFLTKQVNPISVPQGTFYLQNQSAGGTRVPSTLTVSADQMSIVLTPKQNLQPDTQYYLGLGTTYDIVGNYLSGTAIYFTTGEAATTIGASVISISPASGTAGVPLNVQVVAVMSAPVSQNTFGASPITVKNGSTLVAGTTTLASDELTLTFVPTTNLVASTTYTMAVGGFEDQNGNTVQTGTGTFTTGGAAQTAAFSVLSMTPAANTTISSNTTPIVLTFNEAVDASTVSNILIRDSNVGYSAIAGSFAVNGTVVTFTPLSAYPANHSIQVYVPSTVLSLTGGTTYYVANFTTANMADTTAPTVTSVTPVNGSTSVGDAPTVVLTFSKSMNQSTLNTTSVVVFAGDSQFNYYLSFPADARTALVHLNGQLPPSTLVTISVSGAAQDLSGNSLAPFQSQFTTAAAQPTQTQAPAVIKQIPANGATGIAQGAVVTLYTSGTAIDASTLNSATLQVSQNGQLVSGSIALIGNGHAIELTPSAPLAYSSLIQIFLNQGVMDTSGYALQSAYTGQFTVQGAPASTPAQMTGSSPLANATVVPNVKPQMRFDQPILASSLNANSVRLYDNCHGTTLAGTPSLVGTNIVQFTPSADLSAATCATYYLQLFTGVNGVTNTSGVAISGNPYFYFTVAGADDTSAPTVAAVGPPSGTQKVGINASVYVQFNKAIDELSVTGSTVQITGASQTVIPASISFDATGKTAIIQPSTPLPPSTTVTITINGVTDPEGNIVTPASGTFTTMAGPDFTAPKITSFSFANGDTMIPLNTTAFSVTFNKPMDPLTFNPTSFRIYDNQLGLVVTPASITNSADLMTYTIVIPSGKLVAGDGIYLQVLGVVDLSGNVDGNDYVYGTVGSTNDTTAPTVTEVNPQSNLTNVPTNTLPQVEFSKEISNVTAQAGIQLLQGSTAIPATITLSRGGTVATITPLNPLTESTQYTISVGGVADVQGTVMASAYTSKFTTSATGISLVRPTVVSVTPANGAIGVSASVAPVVVFSEAMNPLNFDPSLVYAVIENNANSVVVPAAVTFSADGKSVTFTPVAPFTSGTTYRVYIPYYDVTDVAGNVSGNTLSSTFTIQ